MAMKNLYKPQTKDLLWLKKIHKSLLNNLKWTFLMVMPVLTVGLWLYFFWNLIFGFCFIESYSHVHGYLHKQFNFFFFLQAMK